MKKIILLILLMSYLGSQATAETKNIHKPRTIVTTDGEIDDVDSFIRMLLMANEFTIEGLVYSSSMFHYKGDGKGTRFISQMPLTRKIYGERTELRWVGTQWMQDLIGAYQKVYPTLSTHAEGFPTAERLLSRVYVGNIDFEGDMQTDTAGSDFIKAKLLDKETTPLYLQAWGGTNTIARALKSIEESYKDRADWSEIYQRVSKKAIVYIVLDQDATYKKYIAKHWPDIRVYLNTNQFGALAYWWKDTVPEAFHPYLEGDFMATHIINGHGPLTKKYYSWGDGRKQKGDDFHTHGDVSELEKADGGPFGKYDFISEGDSPAFIHLVDVGLNNLQHPEYGGWSGRLEQSDQSVSLWKDGDIVWGETFKHENTLADFSPYTGKMDSRYPQSRWLDVIQLEFAARADWSVKPYSEANHPPIVRLNNENNMIVKPGQAVTLSVNANDPDGDTLSYLWWQYAEVDSYRATVKLSKKNSSSLSVNIPSDLLPGQSLHFIVTVTDSGVHPLTRYQRVVLTGQ